MNRCNHAMLYLDNPFAKGNFIMQAENEQNGATGNKGAAAQSVEERTEQLFDELCEEYIRKTRNSISPNRDASDEVILSNPANAKELFRRAAKSKALKEEADRKKAEKQALAAAKREQQRLEQAAREQEAAMANNVAGNILTDMLGEEMDETEILSAITETPQHMLKAKDQHESKFPPEFWLEWAESAKHWVALRGLLLGVISRLNNDLGRLELEDDVRRFVEGKVQVIKNERQDILKALNWILYEFFGLDSNALRDPANHAPQEIFLAVTTAVDEFGQLSWFFDVPEVKELVEGHKEHLAKIQAAQKKRDKQVKAKKTRDAFYEAVLKLFEEAGIAAPEKLAANVARKQFGVTKSAIQACRNLALGKQKDFTQKGGEGVDATALKYAKAGLWDADELVAEIKKQVQKAQNAAAKKATDLTFGAAGPNIGKKKKEQAPNSGKPTGKKPSPGQKMTKAQKKAAAQAGKK